MQLNVWERLGDGTRIAIYQPHMMLQLGDFVHMETVALAII